MKAAVNQHFVDEKEKYFLNGLQALYKHEKYITLEGDYTEK